MKSFVLLFFAMVCLVACNHDDDEPWSPSANASRTVMIYMSGENNLTYSSGYRFLRNDLNEIIEGSKHLSDNQRLLVFVDSLNTNKLQSGNPVILEVHGGEVYTRYEFDSDFYSCDPHYFKEVLQWMTSNAKADSYGLVLWGHASGWIVSNDTISSSLSRKDITRAYGQDDGTDASGNGVKWMNITQMARALEGLPKMEFIFADCCNMMCAEVGYELRNATKYLIGSPAEIPGEGAPYDKIIPYLYKNDSELYKGVIDTYYNYYLEDYKSDIELKGYSVPLSVIDTRQMDNLASATHDVLATFAPVCPESPMLDGLAYYWYYDAPIMYDMKAVIKANATLAAYSKWEESFKLAVPYYRMSMQWMTIYNGLEYRFGTFNQDENLYGCVSMFVPLNTPSYTFGIFRLNSTYTRYGWNRVVDWSRFGW